MAERHDEAELAIHHIRRVTKLADLEQIQAVLIARRVELINNSSRTGHGKSNGPSLYGAKPVKPAPRSTLDPAHKRDPVYLDYAAANSVLDRYCVQHKVARSAVTGPVRDAFDKALAAWVLVKPRYKTDGKARPASHDAGVAPVAQTAGAAASSSSTLSSGKSISSGAP